MNAPKASNLIPPFKIIDLEIYRDGGSIIMELEDNQGTSFSHRFDGRLGTPTPDRLYLNLRSPVPTWGSWFPGVRQSKRGPWLPCRDTWRNIF
jgi:hypothetical protein